MPAVCSKRLYSRRRGDRSHRASQARAGSVLGLLELAAYLPPMPRTEDGHGDPRPLHDPEQAGREERLMETAYRCISSALAGRSNATPRRWCSTAGTTRPGPIGTAAGWRKALTAWTPVFVP